MLDVKDTKLEARSAAIRGLRELAVFLEEHPSVPLPCLDGQNAFVGTRDELTTVARAASWQKLYMDEWFILVREFSGGVSLHINAERSQVCRRVVTGTRIVPAQPEHKVEDVEWVCEDASLLAETV